jgi:probable HAF family extracellular repeat protein
LPFLVVVDVFLLLGYLELRTPAQHSPKTIKYEVSMRHWLFLPAFGLSCALLAAEPAISQTYTVTDLGTFPGGDFSTALGIDELGQVTGWSGSSVAMIGGVPGDAFLYRDGKLLDLGGFGGPGSIGYGIANDKEKDPLKWDEGKRKVRVTGSANDAQDQTHAFLYEDHFLRDLGFLPGGTTSTGFAVNSSGEVVGEADNADGAVQAFLYKHGNMVSLGTLGGTGGGGGAFGINDQGDVTGTANTASGAAHAFLYRHGKMIDLGTLPGGVNSAGTAINDSLQITGGSSPLDGQNGHAFLWSKGKMTDLGVLPTGNSSQGTGINAFGQVVGGSDIFIPSNLDFGPPGEYISHGFLYENGQLHDLNDLIAPGSGWVLGIASGINDRGEIAGTGTINGETHGYLLKLDCKNRKNKDCEACRTGQ